MRSKFGRKLLSCLLVPMLLFGTVPGGIFAASAENAPEACASARELLDALRETAAAPGRGNAEQNDGTYLFGGKAYKVIYNGFIACYVSVEDGSFTILPATAKFDPDKPASRATFSIDGESYAFGEVRGEIDAGDGTIFIPPVVENDMAAAHWAVGDYVISQYLAITKDAAHENAYAVKVGYGAEYFGTAPSEISGEILIDTLLGAEDDLPLRLESGEVLTAGTTLRPVPDALYVSADDTDGEKAFLVLREEKGTAADAVLCGDFARLRGGAVPDGGAAPDSAVKLLFDAAKAGGDPDAAQNDIALFNANYGFYDLSPAQIELTPAMEPLASRSMTRTGALMALGEGAHRLYYEAREPNSIAMIAPSAQNGEACVNAGEAVSFYAKLVNDGRIASELAVKYSRAASDGAQEASLPVTPDGNSIYTFAVPSDIYVAGDFAENGSVGINITASPAAGALHIPDVINKSVFSDELQKRVVEASVSVSSGGAIDLGHGIAALKGDKVTVELKRMDSNYAPVLKMFIIYDGGTPIEIQPLDEGNDIYTYTVGDYPANATLSIEVDSVGRGAGTQHIVNKRIVREGNISDATLKVESKTSPFAPDEDYKEVTDAGLSRVATGHTVKVSVLDLSDTSNAKLDVINLSDGSLVFLSGDMSNGYSFTMPSANVELVLNLTSKPIVTTRINYPLDGDPDSGASLTLSPANPAAGDMVTVNINLLGGGYNLKGKSAHADGDVNSYLKIYKTDNPNATQTLSPVVYQQSYQFTMPNESVTAELSLENVPAPPALYPITTMPFVGEGKTIFNIAYWVQKNFDNDVFQNGALDEAGKTMKAPAGSEVMFYASKASDANDWNLKRVYLVIGEDDAVVEQDLPIRPEGDAYSFTMPSAPVTIAVEAQKDNAPGQIITETYVKVGTKEYPYSDLASGSAGNIKAYEAVPGGGGELTESDGVHIGDQIFIAAYPMYGGKLISVTAEQEGYAPLDIRGTGVYNQQLGADVYSFTAMRGSVFRVKAVYDPSDIANVSITGCENDENLAFVGERNRTLLFGQIYDPAKPALRGTASTIIELKTADDAVGNLIYTLELDADRIEFCNKEDVALKLLEYRQGYAKYELSVSAAPSANAHPSIPIYVEKADFGKRPVIESMTVNHTGADKFQYVLIKGQNLRNLIQESPSAYDYNLGIVLQQSANQFGESWLPNTYSAGADRSTLVASSDGTEAKLYVKNLNFELESPAGAAAQPPFAANNNYCLQLDWSWGGELGIGPNIESDAAWTTWELTDLSFNYSPNDEYPCAFVLKSRNGAFYAIELGKTPDALPDAYDQIVAAFECKDGFALAKNADGSTAIAPKNPKSSILVNGMLTLEPSGAAGVPFALTQKDDTVTLNTNMKLVAKGTTLFSPVGSMGSLEMKFEQGRKYSNDEENKTDVTELPTFTPRGDISVDIFGYNGFRADYDAIKLSSKTNSVRLTGGLSLQVPGVNMPLAGLTLEKLQLNLANASPGFDGIKASGNVNASIAIIALNGAADVDTFNNYYRFEGEVEVPVFEARGYLELTESERFKIPMLEAFHIQVAADKGIPLVPPVVVGYLNGLEGGIFGLASTLDYDPTNPAKPILPPLRIAAGARFQLLELLEFWVELTAGPAYFKQSMHDMYINLKGINFQLVEELTMEVGVYTEPGASGRSRVGFGYNARLRINLLKGIVSDIFLAQGDLNISASMDHPSYWIDKQETYTDALTLLKAINAQFAASGKVAGTLQIPPFSILGNDYGPFRIASAGAWFDAGIPLSEQIRATRFRAGMDLAWGIFGIKVDYDFMSPWQPPNFDISLFSESGGEGALYAETLGDGNSGGRITIGEGIRVTADSFGETGVPAQDAGIRTFAAQVPGAIAVYGDANSFTHTVTVPQDGRDHWIQAASLVVGTDMNLTVYDPDGDPVALRPAPYNATAAAEQGQAYNALRANDGSGLIFRADEPGDYRLTSNGEFRSRLMEADPRPEIAGTSAGGTLSLTAENLDSGANYRYRVVLEKKDAYGDETENAFILDEGAISGAEPAKTLTIADFGLDDALETGNYFPTVLLYRVSGQDDPATQDTDEERRELISVSNVYTPVSVTNASAAEIAPGALSDLTVTAAGNESVNLTFAGATVAPGFGAVRDDSSATEAPATWKPSHYLVNLYDETGKLAAKAVDDGKTQTEAPLSFTVSEDLKGANGRFDVLLAGIPGGHSYTAEVTPVFVCEYEMPDAMKALTDANGKTDKENYGNNSIALEQKGVPVTETIAVPKADPPRIAIETFKSTKTSVNGTATYYLSEGAYLDVTADPGSEITVRKYSAGAGEAPLRSAANALRLTDADFADRENEIMSSGLFAITAKNAAGDTATELVNIAVDKSAPFLLIDGLTARSRNAAADGAFTITGTTEPGARVVSSTGQSAVGGADGRFTLQGVISGSGEDVLITATDAAGNATTEGMTMLRAGGGGGDFGGGGGGGGGAAPRDPAAEDGKAPSAGWTNPFTDVDKSAWYYGDVEFVLANGLFVGTSATSFGPQLPMTRGMIVTVLGRLAKIDTGQYAGGSFDDVAADKYYAAFARWAKESGIVSGVGGNLFAPDNDVTRQDMAVIFFRYARFMGIELPKREERQPFADEARIAGYASEAVYAMREAGIITGKPGNLADPQGKATRAEVAAMFHRFVEATK